MTLHNKQRGRGHITAIRERNEEREEFEAIRRFEDNGMMALVLSNNDIEECRENNKGSVIKDGCIVSRNCTVGEKTRIDKCILSPFVNIGKNCKIINCVILKHCTIGDQCKISNTIISGYTKIGDKCTVHNCKIAGRANIAKETTLKNEVLESGMGNTGTLDELNAGMKGLNVDEHDHDNILNID